MKSILRWLVERPSNVERSCHLPCTMLLPCITQHNVIEKRNPSKDWRAVREVKNPFGGTVKHYL